MQNDSALRVLLTSLVESQRLTAGALERINERLDVIEDFLSRIPPSFMPVFNEFIEKEDGARLGFGLLNIVRDGDAFSMPFPQDVKDRRATQGIAEVHPLENPSAVKEVADWQQPSSAAKTDTD